MVDCVICYEVSNLMSSCKHHYCKSCFDKWFSINSICAYCRQKTVSQYSTNLEQELYALTGGKLII